MIPIKLLPKTLQIKVTLSNIGKIECLHKRAPELYFSSNEFMRQFVPSIRYYNGIIFNHKIDPQFQSPVFKIFDKQNNEVNQFESANMTHEEILQQITYVDKNL